ncbi:hypothetical protein UA08_00473 [Talaromyces atroroseus]|uniref:Zn(2)-C6 fungal-type domain-containing protein n=1 Tax=Talaromyces atroroseus TaxID=1441469 RepID=A0A225AQM4_TALAT|nr:hypothetical protein UA08_00473 [Talaromyces atroroseus]OKL63921.1 hypothetical protein UA08_00473 [Talaromyces atroroseus]
MPPNRRACDRCHNQKLRCPRHNSNDNESCMRCLEIGASCVYSAPKPTGRPSSKHYSRAHISRDRAQRDSSSSSNSTAASGSSRITATTQPSSMDKPIVEDAAVPLPPLPALHAPMMAAAAANLAPDFSSPMVTVADLTLTGADDSHEWTSFLGYDLHQVNVSNNREFESFPVDVDNFIADGLLVDNNSYAHDTGISEARIGSTSTTSRLPRLWPRRADQTEVLNRRLSDLNTRLYPVYKTSCLYVDAQKEFPDALILNATFDAASNFLASDTSVRRSENEQQPERGCKAVIETFQTSADLLDVLHQYLTSFGESKQSLRNLSESSVETVTLPAQSLTTELTPVTSADNSDKINSVFDKAGFDSVTPHLCIACYIRLLHIYQRLIEALRNDATSCKENRFPSETFKMELRLVLVVGLIVSLLDRLRTSIAAYLSILDDQVELPELTGNDLGTGTAVLEARVQAEIQQLQATLRISSQ